MASKNRPSAGDHVILSDEDDRALAAIEAAREARLSSDLAERQQLEVERFRQADGTSDADDGPAGS